MHKDSGSSVRCHPLASTRRLASVLLYHVIPKAEDVDYLRGFYTFSSLASTNHAVGSISNEKLAKINISTKFYRIIGST